jgi:hypothetical protein
MAHEKQQIRNAMIIDTIYVYSNSSVACHSKKIDRGAHKSRSVNNVHAFDSGYYINKE